jgi:hypothetical protein
MRKTTSHRQQQYFEKETIGTILTVTQTNAGCPNYVMPSGNKGKPGYMGMKDAILNKDVRVNMYILTDFVLAQTDQQEELLSIAQRLGELFMTQMRYVVILLNTHTQTKWNGNASVVRVEEAA